MAHTLRRLALILVVALMAVTFVAGTSLAQQASNPPAQGGDQTMQSAPAQADEKPAKKKKAKANKKTSKKKAKKKADEESEKKQ